MTNRRQFLVTFPAFLAARPLLAADTPKQSLWIGSCAPNGAKNGIYHAWFNPQSGILSEPTLAAATPVPSFFATLRDARGRQILYTVNELSHGNGGVSSFVLDPTRATLTPLNHASTSSSGPCYLSTNAATRTVYTANYSGSGVSVFRALPDGSLTPEIQHLDLKDTARFGHPGPHPRQGAPHPHSVTFSPDKKFAVVNDLGNDSIDIFAVGPDGRLSDAGPKLIKTPPATGPRHIAFHPNGKWVYGIDELANTLRLYAWHEQSGTATLDYTGRSISSLAPGTPTEGRTITASELVISPDGKFLYASNRFENTLCVFTIAPADGALAFRQVLPSGGKVPRQFTFDPLFRHMVCGNSDSSSLAIFHRNPINGTLSGPTQTLSIDSPEFALFT